MFTCSSKDNAWTTVTLKYRQSDTTEHDTLSILMIWTDLKIVCLAIVCVKRTSAFNGQSHRVLYDVNTMSLFHPPKHIRWVSQSGQWQSKPLSHSVPLCGTAMGRVVSRTHTEAFNKYSSANSHLIVLLSFCYNRAIVVHQQQQHGRVSAASPSTLRIPFEWCALTAIYLSIE